MYFIDIDGNVCFYNSKNKNWCIKNDQTTFLLVSSNNRSTIALDVFGNAWVQGLNPWGQLGLGEKSKLVWTQVPNLPVLTKVRHGGMNTMILDAQGSIWSSGQNFHGKLALGDDEHRKFFSKIDSPIRFQHISLGYDHSVALDCDGNLWGAGSDWWGQLALGSRDNHSVFKRINHPNTIISVECGSYHTIALDTSEKIWGTGNNKHGQLGFNDRINRNNFEQINEGNFSKIFTGSNATVALDIEGNVWYCGTSATQVDIDRPTFHKILTFKNVVFVSVFIVPFSIYLLDTSRELWCLNLKDLSLHDLKYVPTNLLTNEINISVPRIKASS